VAATLEWLADMELEARNQRAIERRFKCSRLQALTASTFNITSPGRKTKTASYVYSTLSSCTREPTRCSSGISGSAKHSYRKSLVDASAKPTHPIHYRDGHVNHMLASQVDHSLFRKLKAYTEPTALVIDELGYLASISRLRICFIKSSPHGTAKQTLQLLL
jgi:hypothetical protein